MKQSKTTIKELTKRYRAVLLKCALINAAAFTIAFSAAAAPLTVGSGQSSAPESGTYDYIEVNDGTLTLNNGEFSTLRNDPSSLTDAEVSLFNASLDMNSPAFTISNSTLTINTGSQIAGRAVTINSGSELTLNAANSQTSFEADSFTINGSTVFMSGGGYGLAASSDNGISITDSTVTANSANIAYTASEDGNAISNPELKISGTSEFNVMGNVKIDAVSVDGDDVSSTKGKIIFSGGTINLNGKLTADIEATGGTLAFNSNNAALNGTLTGTIDALNVSGGTIENQEIFVSGDAVVSGGTFSGTRIVSDDITVSGGNFIGRTSLLAGNNLTLSGGVFDSALWAAGTTTTIDSDHVILHNTENELFEFGSYSSDFLGITGTRGISVKNTITSVSEISGKITAGANSLIGSFNVNLEEFDFNGQKAYLPYSTYILRETASFNNADITLNDNAQLGTGYAAQNLAYTLKVTPTKLTNSEIEESVSVILDQIRNINNTTKNITDLPESIQILIGGQLLKWSTGEALNESELNSIATDMPGLWTTFGHNTLDAYSANVTVTDSTVTMNGTSALANYSFADTKGNITVNNSTVTANGTNTISAAKGNISFENGSTLAVSKGAVLSVVSQDSNTVSFDGTSSLNLAGTLNGNVSGGTVNVASDTARVNGTIADSTLTFNSASARLNGALSGTVNLTFNDNYAFGNVNASNATLGTITIADGKTLDIGEGTLTASNITGGILKATLTDAAKTSAIVTASATNVTLALDMSSASRDEVTQYHITDGTGFSFADYNTSRYAISSASFDIESAKTLSALDGWTGGDLYILRLATAGEAAVEDLKNAGVPVSANEEKAIAALNDEVIDRLAPAQKAAAQKINALIDTLSNNITQLKQILREVAPEAAPSTMQTASSNAGAVMNVVSTRMGGSAPAPAVSGGSSARGGAPAARGGAPAAKGGAPAAKGNAPASRGGAKGGASSNGNRRGRSGGDYTAGALTAWAQGMYNRGDLHKADGFDSDSSGFAAGLEYTINEDVKAGIGYAYTDTDIETTRSKTDVDTHTGFVYGEYKPNNLYVNGVLSYGHSKYDEKTKLAGLQSEYLADTFAMQAMTGYTFGDITPEVGLRYTSVRQKEYTNALGAHMSGKTSDTWTWVGGVKAAKTFQVNKTTVTPDAKIALTYDFKRDGQARMVTLANGSSYVAEGESMKRFGVEVGAGVSVKVGNNTDISLSYEGKFKDHYTDHTGLINFRYNF